MVDREARDEAVIEQIGVESSELLGQEHALVDDRAARERADVEILDLVGDRPLLDAAAQDIEIALENGSIGPAQVAEHDLLDLGTRRIGLLADDVDVHPHLAPAIDDIAEIEDLGLDDRAAALLPLEIGARQEDHADGELARARLMTGLLDVLAEEILWDLDMDAGAVAGLAVGIDG